MRFMIIVKATRDSEAGVMPDEKILTTMANYHEELAKAGVLVDASGLKPSSKGWRVKYAGTGKPQVVDGPFTEAKELIAGYTIINVKSREKRSRWTRRFPNPSIDGKEAEIEVRPMFEPRGLRAKPRRGSLPRDGRRRDAAALAHGTSPVRPTTPRAPMAAVRPPAGENGRARVN